MHIMRDNHDYFDRQLKDSIDIIVCTIDTPPSLLNNIKSEIYKKERSEERMKGTFASNRRIRTAMAITICMVLLVGGAVGAKSLINKNVKGFISSDVSYSAADEELIKSLGFVPRMPETLPGGFNRTKIETADYLDGTNQARPIDPGQKLVNALYQNPKIKDAAVVLSVSNTSKDSDMFSTYEDIMINNVKYQYKSYEFYVLPSGYVMTEEEAQKERNREAYFAYVSGIKEKEVRIAQCIKWVDKGVYYQLTDLKNNLSKDNIIEMAEYISNQK